MEGREWMLDALFVNGRFYTQTAARPWASKLGVFGGRVVGVDDEVEGLKAREVIDLKGAPVVPGFNDAHHHLSGRGRTLRWVDLGAESAPTLDALYEAVGERARSLPEGAWVFGSGYDQNKIGSHPTAAALDQVSGGRPVWLRHNSGHMSVGNTAAFERAGYPGRAGVPDVEGGRVFRDDQGLALGLVQERAQRLLTTAFMPHPVEDIVDNIAAASERALREGLTSVTEPGIGSMEDIGNSPADLHAFQVARESGALGVRVTVMPYLTLLHRMGVLDGWYGLDLGARSGLGDEWLRIGPAKILSDGSLIGRSAAMRCCYHEDAENKGFMLRDPEELQRMVVLAHRSGWEVAVHAIGDLAVDHVLDCFAEAQRAHPRPQARHRIEHFGVADDEQIARTAALGVIAVPQGRFVSELGDGMINALGPERADHCYRMRSLLAAGMVLPGSSDAPVVAAAPLLGIHDMVNRTTASGRPLGAQEALTVAEAIRAYTLGSAYAVHEEHEKGTLERGRLADFAVLSDNPFEIPSQHLKEVSVGATVVGGRVAYSGGAL